MCKLLADLVGADEQVVKEVIARLEHASAAPGVDIRLSGEIYGRLHMKIRELGLDPQDTTPHELYQALLNLAALHDQFLAKRLGVKDATNPADVLPIVVQTIERMHVPKQAWVMTHVAAKRLMKAVPPKTLMKHLGYRSLDSMLKREPSAVLFTVARNIESESWQRRMVESYKHLKPGDFESRDVEVVYLHTKHWQALGEFFARDKHTTIVHAPEAGAIAILPMPAVKLSGLTLISLLLTLHYLNEIRMYSTYFKFRHLEPHFGKRLGHTLLNPGNEHAHLAGQPIHWRVIHRYYGGAQSSDHPELFEPHLQPEDMAYRKAEDILYRLEPALHFWYDLDYVGLPQASGALSFNLTDVAMNLVNRLDYHHRSSYHLRDALWNELYSRYVGQDRLEQELLQQLGGHAETTRNLVRDLEFV